MQYHSQENYRFVNYIKSFALQMVGSGHKLTVVKMCHLFSVLSVSLSLYVTLLGEKFLLMLGPAELPSCHMI